jgi:hypothetical protein
VLTIALARRLLYLWVAMSGMSAFVECPNPLCGIPVDPADLTCPKCDTSLHDVFSAHYYEIDVAHAGQTREEARLEIEEGLNTALLHRYKGLRVIHGFGGANRNRGVIAREARYVMQRIAQRKGYGFRPDGDNPGAHIIDFGS